MMAGFWASRNHSKLCLRTCVAILLLLVFFHIAQRHGNQEEIYKRDLLASTEIPAEYIDPTSIDLTPLVNTLIHSTQLGSSQLFSLLSVTSHSSLALHKLTLLVYNISNFRSIADNMFPRRYCYCVTNETNDLTDFTAILLDVMGNSTSYLQELFKSSSILSDKYLSQLWEVDSIMPLFNQTITESAPKGNHSVNFDPSLTSRVHSTAHVSSTASEMTSTAPPTTTSRTRTTSFLTSTRAQPTTTTPSPTTKTRTRTTGRPTSISVPHTTTSRTTVLMTPTTALPITITAQPTITKAPPSTTTAQQSRSTALPTTTQSTTDRPTTSTALPTTAQPTTALPIPALLPKTTVLPTTTTAQPTTTTALRIMTTATPTAAQPIPTSVQLTKVPSSTTTDQLTTTAQPTTTTPQLTTVQVTTTTTQLTTTTDQPTTALPPTIRFRMTTTPVRLTMTTTPSTITAILITATKAQPTTDTPATGQAMTTTPQLPTAQQTTTTIQLTTTTAPWTITNITTTATRVITKAPITEKPGCPWRRPGLAKIEERRDNSITSSTTTVSAHKLQPCVLELCKFFSQCLCHSYSYKTHMKRYCADSHLWYEKHTFEVCRRVRRVSFSRNLKQRCLARMCNKLWPEWKRDRESGIY
uniref:HERV-H LTR-associating protein 1 n=1 Tax=Oncorhynchus kisutch TaxID=8019 RepID=A0A8C7JKW5_ONCKI